MLQEAWSILANGPIMPGALVQSGITSFLRQAHFLAQVCEESFGLSDLEEEASGREYEGRARSLGNTHKGDGVRFKGRGLIQITGRSNYKRVGTELNLDLVANPKLAQTPAIAISTACRYWIDHHLNALADNDDIKGIPRVVISHRMLGLKEREQ